MHETGISRGGEPSPEHKSTDEPMAIAQSTSITRLPLPSCLLDRLTSSWQSGDGTRQIKLSKGDWRIWLGKAGETFAAEALKAKGWLIEARNWRAGRYAEIDIVALDPSGLRVFVEVKTRRRNEAAKSFDCTGFEAINKTRRRKIITSAGIYLAKNGITDSSCRFDVIAVQWLVSPHHSLARSLSMPEIIHVENAFLG